MTDAQPHSTLPIERLERVEGWGGAVGGASYVYRPSTVEQLQEILRVAREMHRSVTIRGAGRSYGDASLGNENILIEMTRMNRILEWDPVEGIITVEAGVTIKQLWEYIIQDGYWPPVVPGTMYPTIGGCLGMNIHGKNNFKAGPIGDHVLSFDFLAASGEMLHVDRTEQSELFHSIIGSFGMFGCFTRVTLRMKRVYSGDLDVKVLVASNFAELIALYDRHIPESDYLVGWIDAFGTKKELGRAIVHQANYLAPGVDPIPAQTLRLEHQNLPDTIMGIVPKSIVWMFLAPFVNNLGMSLVNWAKFVSAKISPKKQYRQAHAAFAFLLDYVPNWKKSYGKEGLVQYQSFVSKETAEQAFSRELELCQKARLVPFLAVFKRHKPDAFLMTHAVDGYSLALDFKVTKKNRKALWQLTGKLNEIVLQSGGRFYMAKDATLTPSAFRQYLGDATLSKFLALKKRFDPDDILSTGLSRRLLDPNRSAINA